MRSGIVDTQPPQYRATHPIHPIGASVSSPAPLPRPAPRPEPRLLLAPAEGWSPLVLLAIALYCVVYAIITAKWVDHSDLLLWGPAFGLLVGLAAAKLSRPSQSLIHLAACLVGYWLAVGVTASLAFHVSWMQVLGDLHDALFGGLVSGNLASGKVIFFFYLVFLCFFLGHFGSWLVYRARLPWLVALVYSSIMFVNLNYVPGDSTLFVVILLAALILLVARIQLIVQLVQWTRDGLYTDDTWVRAFTARCMSVASIFMVFTLLLGSTLPIFQQTASGKTFWDNLNNAINNLSSGRVSLQDPSTLFLPYGAQKNFFGDQLMITGSVHLPTGDILTYSSTAGPRYLEGFAYNSFTGQLWASTVNTAHGYSANETLPADSNRTDLEQITTSVTIVQPSDGPKHYLFGPAQPIKFSVPSLVYSDGAAVAWTRSAPFNRGDSYQVVSQAPVAGADILMSVPLPGDDTRGVWRSGLDTLQDSAIYVQVPFHPLPQVKQTALQWTQGARDTYSALKMLEEHLSDQKVFKYSVDNPPIPNNVDVVDWLLQEKAGYCTYYASAMAVMARQLGIPTRMINGFSQGHFDKQRNTWVVTGSDAHSWVQAYLPSIGWVNFDPTPGFSRGAQPVAQGSPGTISPTPTPITPRATAPAATPAVHVTPPTIDKQGHNNQVSALKVDMPGWLLPIVIVLLIGLLLLLLYGLAVRWWRGLYAHVPLVTGLFWRLCLLASWLGLAPRNSQTPHEYGYMLSQHFPQQAQPLRRLTDLFVRERWGAPYQVPQKEEQQEVEHFWPMLRTTLVRARLQGKK